MPTFAARAVIRAQGAKMIASPKMQFLELRTGFETGTYGGFVFVWEHFTRGRTATVFLTLSSVLSEVAYGAR